MPSLRPGCRWPRLLPPSHRTLVLRLVCLVLLSRLSNQWYVPAATASASMLLEYVRTRQ